MPLALTSLSVLLHDLDGSCDAKVSFAMCAAAPSKFLGNKGAVFGGLLTYKLGFFEYNSENEDFIHDFDVVLARQPVRPLRLRG